MPGQVTIFTSSSCPDCERAKTLLLENGAGKLNEISITENQQWLLLLFLLSQGKSSLPQIFLNHEYFGGRPELEEMITLGKLKYVISECLNEPNPMVLPELRTPDPKEYFQLVPTTLREGWQSYIDDLNTKISSGGKPVELVMMMMDTPVHKMVVVCSAGAASSKFKVGGAGADKGSDGSEEKLYCQIVMQEKKTIFLNDPTNFPTGLKNNEDYIKYGYGYYIGAPWRVDDMRGTIVALDKTAGVLKDEHVPIIENVRNNIEKEWKKHLGYV